jgi:hypothetical protein
MLQVKAHTALQFRNMRKRCPLRGDPEGSPENAAALIGIGRAFVETGRGPEAVQAWKKRRRSILRIETPICTSAWPTRSLKSTEGVRCLEGLYLQEPDSHVTARIVKQMTYASQGSVRWAKER